MTTTMLPRTTPAAASPPPPAPPSTGTPWRKRHLWNRFTPLQLLVMAISTIPLFVILGSVGAGLVGAITTEAMAEVALAAGENPGTIIFGLMFLATPMQWLTGRTQIRVRKYLGIVFYLLALSNGAMFVVESGISGALGEPFLIAGSIALGLATPLFMTSSRWSQRMLGMARWRVLHKLTYVVAIALLSHVILIGDLGLGFVLIAIGFISRVAPVRRWLEGRGAAK